MRVSRIVGLVVLVWLVIGAIAAGQRGYYTDREATCSDIGTLVLTVVAGPLNYMGVNPKAECDTPEPSS